MNKKSIIIPIVTFLTGGGIGVGAIYGLKGDDTEEPASTGAGPQIFTVTGSVLDTETETEIITDSFGIGGTITYTYVINKEIISKGTENEKVRIVSFKFTYLLSNECNTSGIEDYDIEVLFAKNNCDCIPERYMSSSHINVDSSSIKVSAVGVSNETIFVAKGEETMYTSNLMVKKSDGWHRLPTGELDSNYVEYWN